MHVSLELYNGKGYGHIHRTGCRDLRDPEGLGEVSTKSEAEALAEDLTGWGHEPGEYRFAPCVTFSEGHAS